jgi:Fe-S cluster assembly iron-binding protein IscA
MLTLTREAAQAIRELTETPDADGVRIHAGRRFSRGRAPALQVELAAGPDVEDTVLEAEGARLYVEPETLRALDDKVLDASVGGDEPRFAVFERAEES